MSFMPFTLGYNAFVQLHRSNLTNRRMVGRAQQRIDTDKAVCNDRAMVLEIYCLFRTRVDADGHLIRPAAFNSAQAMVGCINVSILEFNC